MEGGDRADTEEVLPKHLAGGIEDVYKKSQSGQAISGPRYELGASLKSRSETQFVRHFFFF
jgi:hypothetical protein